MDTPASRPNWLKLNLDGAKGTGSRPGFPESSTPGNRFGRLRFRRKKLSMTQSLQGLSFTG
jgi:hypothetical protein